MLAYQEICDIDQLEELKKLYNTEDVVEAIRMAIKSALTKQTHSQILNLCGNVQWEGDLDEMRESRK